MSTKNSKGTQGQSFSKIQDAAKQEKPFNDAGRGMCDKFLPNSKSVQFLRSKGEKK